MTDQGNDQDDRLSRPEPARGPVVETRDLDTDTAPGEAEAERHPPIDSRLVGEGGDVPPAAPRETTSDAALAVEEHGADPVSDRPW